MKTTSEKYHACGGRILFGGNFDNRHHYCEHCMAYSLDEAPVPDGTNASENRAAWDRGDDCSPSADAHRVEVIGEWAGSLGGWRPACSGTENQTGQSDAFASTFETQEEAQRYVDHVSAMVPEEDARECRPRFRIVQVTP